MENDTMPEVIYCLNENPNDKTPCDGAIRFYEFFYDNSISANNDKFNKLIEEGVVDYINSSNNSTVNYTILIHYDQGILETTQFNSYIKCNIAERKIVMLIDKANYLLSVPSTDQIIKTFNAVKTKISIDNYSSFINNVIKASLNDNKSQQILDLHSKISTLQKQLSELYKELFKCETDFYTYVGDEDIQNMYKHQINQLKTLYGITQVYQYMDPGPVLMIRTEPIYIKNPNVPVVHEIGPLWVKIRKMTTSNIHIYNEYLGNVLNIRSDSVHIFTGGNICFGSALSTLADVIKKGNIVDTIITLLSFLETVNITDPYGRILYSFPIVDDGTGASREECLKRYGHLAYKVNTSTNTTTLNELNDTITAMIDRYKTEITLS